MFLQCATIRVLAAGRPPWMWQVGLVLLMLRSFLFSASTERPLDARLSLRQNKGMRLLRCFRQENEGRSIASV